MTQLKAILIGAGARGARVRPYALTTRMNWPLWP